MSRNVLAVVVLGLAGAVLLGPAGRAAQTKRPLAQLIADLKKGEKEQLQAISELEALGPKAAEAVPALIAVLDTKNEDVRLSATMALGKIGQPAVAGLSKAIKSPDEDVRFYAVWALAFVGPPATGATPVVVEALTDKSAQVRRKAAYALGRIDADPKLAVGPLIAALEDSNEDVRQAALAVLPKMGEAAVPPLLQAVKGDKAALRLMAVKALGEMGPPAAAAIPELKALLLATDKGTAEPAASALAGIG